jgi:hypothetical protein
LALINAVTFLFQYQRELKTHRFDDGEMMEYIEVTPADIMLANRLATAVLARSLDDLPPQTRRFLISLHAWAEKAATAAGVALERFLFSRRQAREGVDMGQTQAALHLERLATHEFIIAQRAVGAGEVAQYRLAWTPNERGSGGSAALRGLDLVEIDMPTPVPVLTNADTTAPMCTTPTCRDFHTPVGGVSE